MKREVQSPERPIAAATIFLIGIALASLCGWGVGWGVAWLLYT